MFSFRVIGYNLDKTMVLIEWIETAVSEWLPVINGRVQFN